MDAKLTTGDLVMCSLNRRNRAKNCKGVKINGERKLKAKKLKEGANVTWQQMQSKLIYQCAVLHRVFEAVAC